MSSEVALFGATAAHAGFQLTVTAIAYPALARVPPGRWAEAHAAHTRAITPLVVVVYGALVLAGGWALLAGPGAWTMVALAATAVALLPTAAVAAPAHGRLARGYEPAQIRHLLTFDRVRSISALVAAAAATVAVW